MTDTGQLWLANTSAPPSPLTDVVSLERSYTSLPSSFVPPAALRARGWVSVPVGWLLESDKAFSDEQIAAIRTFAADEGMLVERRVERTSLVGLRWAATGVGTLLALTVLAMTVGLIRAEAARDTRVLTAAGATSTIRRAVTAFTAGGLATAGALLGCLGAYVALVAGYIGDRGSLTPLPLLHLAAILVGVPVAATLAAWLVAGREPSDVARSPLE